MQNGLKSMFFIKEKKNFGSKGKILRKVFNGYPCKNGTTYFCVFFRFRTFCVFFSFTAKKYLFWLRPGVPPPRLRTGL